MGPVIGVAARFAEETLFLAGSLKLLGGRIYPGLGQHGLLGVNTVEGIAWVVDAVIDRIDQTEMLVYVSQQRCPAI